MRRTDRHAISRTAHFLDATVERAYVESRFPFERTITRILVGSILLQDLITVPYDGLVNGSGSLTQLSLLWLGTVITSAVTMFVVGILRTTFALRLAISIWALILISLNATQLFGGPIPGAGSVALFAVSSVLLYVLPLRLRVRMGLGVLVASAFLIPYCLRTDVEPRSLVEISTGFLMANVIGSLISHQFSLLGRREFAAKLREADTRETLDKTSRELSRIERLLPICAHCKKIKDEDGAWQDLETYFRERTEARFSHGICTGCLKTHYDMDLPTVTQP